MSNGFRAPLMFPEVHGPSQDAVSYMSVVSIIEDDYARGYQSGLSGAPDPMGGAPLSVWRGWRDGAADGGYLPRCWPFGRLGARR